ncbi:MAG: hypothetical protein M3M89_03810 [Thermoproteota archaeon]|nr:hypothetical protein [Thermoproteota archaeon]
MQVRSVNKNIDQPIAIEPFKAEIPGLYTLKLLNPTDQVLEAAIGFRHQDDVLSRKNLLYAMTVVIVISLLVIGIALVIAGVIITILDRSQINKMKQFGDISATSYSGYRLLWWYTWPNLKQET